MESTIKRAIVLIALLLVVSPFVAHAAPQAVGADQSFIVESGSMEPAISTGSVIWVEEVEPETIEKRDVATFVADRRGNTVTHRVVDKTSRNGNTYFVTKGDNNEERDSGTRRGGNLVGKVMFDIPLLGYAVRFVGTRAGLTALVIIPMTLLFMDGLWQLYLAFETEESEDSGDEEEGKDGDDTDESDDQDVGEDGVDDPDEG